MAALADAGSHWPTALPYLISSGFLTPDPPPDAYRWTTYGGRIDEVDEQIVYTDKCVVWSQDGAIRKVLTFDTGSHKVEGAILTDFNTFRERSRRQTKTQDGSARPTSKLSYRALCVVLDRGLHIHFLAGASYVLSVPFHIHHAIAAPDGLLIERQRDNSAPSLANLSRGDDDTPILYTLTDPVAGLCPLFQLSITPKPRTSLLYGIQNSLDYGEIQCDHTLVRAASVTTRMGDKATLLFTMHQRTRQLWVWQLWRSDAHSLASVMSSHAATHKISQATRRSSIFNTPILGGTATPNYRRGQEALKGYAATVTQPEADSASTRRRTRKSRAKSTDQPPADDLVSHNIDPQLRAGHRQTRASRRASSLLSRADLAGDPFANSFGTGRGGRRGPSLGTTNDRKSFGASTFRKSRGSTINSLLAPSIKSSHFSMDLDSDPGLVPSKAELDQLAQLRHPPSVVDHAINLDIDGPSHEFVVRKVCMLPGDDSIIGQVQPYKVETLDLQHHASMSDEADIATLFILNTMTHYLTTCQVRVATDHSSIQRSFDDHKLSLLSVAPQTFADGFLDIISVRQQKSAAVACLQPKGTLHINLASGLTRSMALPQMSFTHDLHSQPEAIALDHASSTGLIDVHYPGSHDRRVRVGLQPTSTRVTQLLEVLTSTLDGPGSRALLSTYATVFDRLQSADPTAGTSTEWGALISAMFVFAMGSVSSTRTYPVPREESQSLARPKYIERAVQHRSIRLARHWQILQHSPPPLTDQSARHPKPSHSHPEDAILDFGSVAYDVLHNTATGDLKWLQDDAHIDKRAMCLIKLLFAAHLWREEQKLSTLSAIDMEPGSGYLTPALAQIGRWLRLAAWDNQPGSCYHDEIVGAWCLSDAIVETGSIGRHFFDVSPPSVLSWLEHVIDGRPTAEYPRLEQIGRLGRNIDVDPGISNLLPKTMALIRVVQHLDPQSRPTALVEALHPLGLVGTILHALPEAISSACKGAIITSRAQPVSTWSSGLLRSIEREDVAQLVDHGHLDKYSISAEVKGAHHGLLTVMNASELGAQSKKTVDLERHTITHLMFPDDRRFLDARDITNPQAEQVAECPPEPFWSEAQHLEQQKRVSQFVMVRTLSLPPGDAMINFASQQLVLSERLQFPEFSVKCKMKPMNIISVADQTSYTEEKVGWASFHRGVSRGLHISRDATGIETSWIIFNKPKELTNRHAGLLLALGLTGRLRTMAKWLSYDYLQSRHAMTSVGLLLGLAASSLGTMDTLITRPLSIHIMRMLPPGTAPLNTPLITQTAGLFGLGLVYCNTRHRRMSEVMLTELEHCEIEEAENNLDTVADESYRLAAGFALGFVNLGQGDNLVGLYGMGLLERLLSMAVGSRPIEVVHIMDKCVPASVIAIALVYMKTGNRSVAQKIDVPETSAQLDHVRPDVLLLRSMTKHIIMWDDMKAESGWIRRQIPKELGKRLFGTQHMANGHLSAKARLTSDNVPYFNILCGCAWALSLKYAGSGNVVARDEVLTCLDVLQNIAKEEAYYYDAMLARNTVRRCGDLLALAVATIMAGTGDLVTFRYLRRLHGRVDAVTTYGSHLAAHLAIGALFLGGGTYTFGTSNKAVASLICAFYPIFPADVSDNSAHLQALRHMWVLAAEARCVVIKDLDSDRPICIEIEVLLREGSSSTMRSPCLLPDLDSIESVRTTDPAYWQVQLDLQKNAAHMTRFRKNQVIYVRQKSTREISPVVFDSCLADLNESRTRPAWHSMWQWILDLPAIRLYEQAALNAVLGSATQNATKMSDAGTAIDDRLALARDAKAETWRGLWNLRLLFAWARRSRQYSADVPWLGTEAVQALRSELDRRLQALSLEIGSGSPEPEPEGSAVAMNDE